MKKFHIIIKKNKTGETFFEADTNSIIGSVGTGDGAQGIGLTECNGKELLTTYIAAKSTLEKLAEDNPLIMAIEAVANLKETLKNM